MHTCHHYDCERRIPPRMLMCSRHWFSLEPAIQAAIWREYRPGQEVDKQPSPRYMAVQQLAIAQSAFIPNDEEAALVAYEYLMHAFFWQRRCIAEGHGDPLVGLIPEARAR